jgi:hypothetical protein
MHEGKQVHLMDTVGYGSEGEALEYAKVLAKKHGGQFKHRQLTLKQYEKLQEEELRLIYANGGRYVAARPFVHHADWFSGALNSECSDADDQEEDAQGSESLPGRRWVDGRLVKGKHLQEQLTDLQRRVNRLRIS